jgi:protein SCO1/2
MIKCVFGLCLIFLSVSVLAKQPDLADIAFDQRINERVPLDLTFQDEKGLPVSLQRYFNAKPVILIFAYYQCPNLCGLTLEGLAESLQQIGFTAGKEFQVVIIGIDPEETPAMAAAKAAELKIHYPTVGIESGWHFLTGDKATIRHVADSVGFRYDYDPKLDQYIHAAGIVLLTNTGRIARYFYGVQFPSQVLRLSLIETAKERIGSPIEQVLLLCYDYNPETGQYSVVIMKVLRLASLVTAAMLGGFLGITWLRERRHKRSTSPSHVLQDGESVQGGNHGKSL